MTDTAFDLIRQIVAILAAEMLPAETAPIRGSLHHMRGHGKPLQRTSKGWRCRCGLPLGTSRRKAEVAMRAHRANLLARQIKEATG